MKKKLTRSQKVKGWVFLTTALASPMTLGIVPYFIYALAYNGEAFSSLNTMYILLEHCVIWSMAYFPIIEWQRYSPLIKRV
jgi:hypothetical protein